MTAILSNDSLPTIRIEAMYRIQVRCAISFHQFLTNCSNCTILTGFHLLTALPITSKYWSNMADWIRSVIWIAKPLDMFARRRFTVARALSSETWHCQASDDYPPPPPRESVMMRCFMRMFFRSCDVAKMRRPYGGTVLTIFVSYT